MDRDRKYQRGMKSGMEKTMGLVRDMLGYLGHIEPGPKHKFLTSVQVISGLSPLTTADIRV